MRALLNILFCLLVSITIVNAQERQISGTVTSKSDGLPLPGVNVIIKGTSKGTTTNFDGFYTIQANEGDLIEFSFISMKKTTKRVKKEDSVINVQMKEDSNALDEIVVVAYGTEKETNYYSKSRPKLSSILNGAVQSYVPTSQTKSSKTNQLKSPSKKNKSALFILNGQPISEQEFNNIPLNKIKHVEILNAMQGKVLYGYDGSKGVVVLRTKGQMNKTDLSMINEFLNESYAQIEENHFKNVRSAPLSTFSIDVDKASYSNIRRMINNGQSIPRNAVRIEEMINYFNYEYPQPTGEHPFSINTELVEAPWHSKTQLLKIGLQGKTYKNEDLPASNLTFLIDVSGSMQSQNKLPLLKKAFKLLVKQLRDKDKISIVVYAGAAGVVLESTSGKHKEKILSALNNLEAGGSTAGGAGIKLAYKLAQENFIKNGNNRVILATDGDFNVGASSDNDMKVLIEKQRNSGVFLSVLGFGYGNYKDSKLEILADKGNGNAAYIDNMLEAQKVFGKEFGGTLYTIAKDVKIQLEFNPKKVQAYRLIGYENRLLADEDFKDDTIDAGELGSGHTVTALYEIIPTGVDVNYLKYISKLKYNNSITPEVYNNELCTVKFRYKKPDSDKSVEMVHIQEAKVSDPTPDTQFVSAVALFGMKLRKSKYCNNTSTNKIIKLADQGRGQDENGYRAEFIRLVESYDFK